MAAPRLLDRVRSEIRVRHYSRRTEEAYVHWIGRDMYVLDLILFVVAMSSSAIGQESIFLSDSGCKTEKLFAVLDEARVYASCSSNGAERVMRISVSNMAPSDVGPLRELSIGFCGHSILGASAQSGWDVEIRQSGDDGSVTWSLPVDEVERLGIPARARVGGFVVTLQPGWRKSQWISARWGDGGGAARARTHDC